MSETLAKVQKMVLAGEVEVSQHGLLELGADGIMLEDVVGGIEDAEVVEDYPDAHRGPSVLVLQFDGRGSAFHVVWGYSKARPDATVLRTAYRPDPARWSGDFRRRE